MAFASQVFSLFGVETLACTPLWKIQSFSFYHRSTPHPRLILSAWRKGDNLSFFALLQSISLCCVYMYVPIHACHSIRREAGGQLGRLGSLFPLWVLEIELGSLGLVVNIFPWASQHQLWFFFFFWDLFVQYCLLKELSSSLWVAMAPLSKTNWPYKGVHILELCSVHLTCYRLLLNQHQCLGSSLLWLL